MNNSSPSSPTSSNGPYGTRAIPTVPANRLGSGTARLAIVPCTSIGGSAVEIVSKLTAETNGTLAITDGTLYPVLRRLEQDGLLRLPRPKAGLEVDELQPSDIARQYPQINRDGVRWALRERDAGYLMARVDCQAVLEGFRAEGGEYRETAATPGSVTGGEMQLVGADEDGLREVHRRVARRRDDDR